MGGYRDAKIRAMTRLRLASLCGCAIGICDPVNTTGLLRFSNMKDRAVAVYAMVSVPITKAKKRLSFVSMESCKMLNVMQ